MAGKSRVDWPLLVFGSLVACGGSGLFRRVLSLSQPWAPPPTLNTPAASDRVATARPYQWYFRVVGFNQSSVHLLLSREISGFFLGADKIPSSSFLARAQRSHYDKLSKQFCAKPSFSSHKVSNFGGKAIWDYKDIASYVVSMSFKSIVCVPN